MQLFATYVHNDQRLPGALTRAEVDADPDQASAAALDGDYGKVVKTARVAAKTTWSLGANGSLAAGLSYEGQSLFHPIVNRIFVDFDGPGPNPPVEVFSLLVDTDHRDLGAMVRYDRRVGTHDLLAGLNYGDGSVTGGNYRNLGGQPNGISEYVDNSADSVEAFVVDRWRASDRWTAVFGAQVVSAGRDVRTTNATTGAVSNPNDRYSSVNPRVGVIASLNEAGEFYGNVSRLFEAPTTFQMNDDVRGGNATLDPMTGTVAEVGWRSRPSQSTGTRWTWDFAAYYARISDEILSMDDPNAPGNSLTTNIDKTTHAGVEALGERKSSPLVAAIASTRWSASRSTVSSSTTIPSTETTTCPPHPRTPRAARCCTGMPAASTPAPPSTSSADDMRTSPIPTPSMATN